MRRHFHERFASPRSADAGRFVWDWWHVPDQYTALRTPAYEFFPKALYERFHRKLVLWGRETLGAHDISPPWMSCYIDGCRQELHGDLPHGPWAFVFSLTPWRARRFAGGETILLREEILSHWRDGAKAGARGLEREQIVRSVPPLFNRLTVFDPRIPHGVREVEGPRDVLDGRLVVHGWFVQPRPFVKGPMPAREFADFVGRASERLGSELGSDFDAAGVLSLRFTVGKDGRARSLESLASTLRSSDGDTRAPVAIVMRSLAESLAEHRFKPRAEVSRATLPLIFDHGG